MKLHKEGYQILTSVLVFLLILNGSLQYFFPRADVILLLILIISIVFYSLILWFFRVPSKTFVQDDSKIFAPADGKLVVIEEVDEPEYFKDKRLQVSIFMSPLNVHVNYYPIKGDVKYYKYHPGEFLVAWHPKSSTLNERSSVVVKDSILKFQNRKTAYPHQVNSVSELNEVL